MGKKRVLVNASMYSDKPTGVGVFIREVVERLPVNSERFEFECYSYSEHFDSSIKVNAIRLPLGLEFLRRWISVHRLMWNIFILPFKARKFDIVFSGSSHGTPFFADQIITIHDLIPLNFPDQHRAQRRYFKSILPWILRSTKRILVASEFTRREVGVTYGIDASRIDVIRFGGGQQATSVTTDTSVPQTAVIEQPFFLAVGCSYPHKNIERLIDAFRTIRNDCRLVIIGKPNEYVLELKRRAAADERIVFLDFVGDDDLQWLYRNAVANVYVSLYEGFGFPPYEAATNGTVSIVSSASVLPEIYAESVYYIDPRSVDDIAAAMASFLANDVDLDSYRKHFPELLRKYTWEKTCEGVIESIEKI